MPAAVPDGADGSPDTLSGSTDASAGRSRSLPAARRLHPPRAMHQKTLRAFIASPEHAQLEPRERELVWVDELLDAMDSAGWTWRDLDLEAFEAVLLDGFTWTIERPPDDPVRVARVLDAFMRFAGREYEAPHVEACCAYLTSADAVSDIAAWVRPHDLPEDLSSEARASP
jgi:hypothetical protein